MEKAPATYRVHAKSAADELDYADMVVLAKTFVSWALDEPDVAPHHRTMMIEAGVDYENIAAWVGPGWKAADPSDEPNPIRAMAELMKSAA